MRKPSSRRNMVLMTYEDPRVFADLVRCMDEAGVRHRSSYSHVLHLILDATRTTWNAQYFTDTEQALTYLEAQGFSITQARQGKVASRLLRTMNVEALAGDAAPTTPSEVAQSEAAAALSALLAEERQRNA